jgi:hypothetical protein
MKLRLLPCFTVGIILAAVVFGVVKRQTYTDWTKEEDYLERLQVAELLEKIAISSCDELSRTLPDCPVILRVSVTGDIEHLFHTGRQKVCVQEVYAGSGPEIGQEIYLTFSSWSVSLDGDLDSIERGFVNIMKVGYEYLVFVSEKRESLEKSIPVYVIYNGSFIAPVFCYESQSNVIVPTKGETTYVPYAQVRNNEFFAVSETALEALEKLKSEMLSAYPRDRNSSYGLPDG